MLEQLRQELYVVIGLDKDLSNLSDPVKVAKSQELDVEINKEMYKKLAALKISQKKGSESLRNGKRPTLYERILLKSHGHKIDEYLRVKRENKKYTFVNRNTEEILIIDDCNKR